MLVGSELPPVVSHPERRGRARPKASAEAKLLPPDRIELAIDAQGRRFFNGEALSREQTAERFVLGVAPDGRTTVTHPIRYGVHPARGPGRPPLLGEHDALGFGPADDELGGSPAR